MLLRKFLSFLLLIVVALGTLHATPIATDVAEGNALKWMKSKNHQAYTIKKEISVKSNTSNRAKKRSAPKYKILELEPKGWVIVSLDDTIKPIIGYGDSKIDADNIPPALIEYLTNVETTIEYLNRHPEILKEKRSKELLYTANDYGYVVRPLLWMGSSADTELQGIRWNQGTYYNALTPVDANGDHTWTGCVATAMGQLMRYWKYPSVGKGEKCYTPNTHPEYGEQCANFAATSYDWDNMPLRLTSANSAVAQALYHAGVAVSMDYTPEGSGAWLGDKLKRYFKYQLSISIDASDFTNSEWDTILKKELDEGRPVVYSGHSLDAGHQFIVDGYDTDGYYHFNWGWGGYSNGKFTLEGIEYSLSQSAYIIAPTDPSPQVMIADSSFASCIVDELSLQDSSDIKELGLRYVSSLDCDSRNINSVEELSYLPNLRYLYLGDNNLQGTLNLFGHSLLTSVKLSDNDINTLILPNSEKFNYVSLTHNSKLNILEVENLKNIEYLYAWGTKNIECWEMNALMAKNNISNLSISCMDNPSDLMDTDGDGILNVYDSDDDNDGINDLVDNDIDGDGINNNEDAFPLQDNLDTDGDGIPDSIDTDDDNDGILDTNDDLPLNPNEHTDTDHDGIGNNADIDDDNDGISDTAEIANGLNPLDARDGQIDLDHDGFSNAIEISVGTNIRNANSKPVWVPIMMSDIITFVPAKR